MEKILITGSSHTVSGQVAEIKEGCGRLKHVTIFFENYNFIIKKYKLLSNAVHMILKFEEKEVQIESANCGYGGGGPNASVSVLTMLGLKKDCAERLIFYNDAVDFAVNGDEIGEIDTSLLFFPDIRQRKSDKSLNNKIEHNKNISVDLEKKHVRIYNPQRTCWIGFLNLLSYMEDIRMEYYIGKNSPLESGLYIGKGFDKELGFGIDRPDVKGTEHVNLCLSGSNFKVACLIDKEYEVQVIEAAYLALTGTCLFACGRYQLQFDRKHAIKEILGVLFQREQEIHDVITITKK